MTEGGIQPDDLVTIIGEQTISIRLLQQEKRELEFQNTELREKLRVALETKEPNGL